MKAFFRNYTIDIIVGFFIALYSSLFSYLSIVRFLTFHAHYYDLGIMHQVVYNTSRGHFLEMTNPDIGVNLSRLAIHFDPILALFAPFYWFFASPIVLLIIQSVVVGLGAWGVYLIGHHVLKNKGYSLVFSILYLLYFPLQRANLFDFHSVVLATTFLLFVFYFFLIKKYLPALILVVLSLFTKENVALITFLLGLYVVFFMDRSDKSQKTFMSDRRRIGMIMSIISLGLFWLVVFVVIPHARQGEHFALKYFSTNISSILHAIFRKESFDYVITLLKPVFFLPLLSLPTLFIAASDFAINILSSNDNLRNTYFHYTALITPFILISSIYGFNTLNHFLFKKMPQVSKLFLIVVMIYGLYSSYHYGPLKGINYPADQHKLEAVKIWQNILADDAIKVSTTGQLAPFFSGRRYFYDFLFDPAYTSVGYSEDDIIGKKNAYEKAEYVVIAESEIPQDGLAKEFYMHLIQNQKFQKVFDQNGIEVFQKIASYALSHS